MDITYLPVAGDWMYLVAIIDLYSRYIVGWSFSDTMTSDWCKACLQAVIVVHGEPEIVNTDQGSQFTSHIFTTLFDDIESKLSMDGKGRCIDNIFIERFWQNLKYEKIYLEPSEDGVELYAKVKWYMEFYNTRRPHQSLEYQRPEKVYQASSYSDSEGEIFSPIIRTDITKSLLFKKEIKYLELPILHSKFQRDQFAQYIPVPKIRRIILGYDYMNGYEFKNKLNKLAKERLGYKIIIEDSRLTRLYHEV